MARKWTNHEKMEEEEEEEEEEDKEMAGHVNVCPVSRTPRAPGLLDEARHKARGVALRTAIGQRHVTTRVLHVYSAATFPSCSARRTASAIGPASPASP
jgi:hypothetical protein